MSPKPKVVFNKEESDFFIYINYKYNPRKEKTFWGGPYDAASFIEFISRKLKPDEKEMLDSILEKYPIEDFYANYKVEFTNSCSWLKKTNLFLQPYYEKLEANYWKLYYYLEEEYSWFTLEDLWASYRSLQKNLHFEIYRYKDLLEED